MSVREKLIPTSSQTVGPYFKIGLECLRDRAPAVTAGGKFVEIHGRVVDAAGAGVPDAVLEFWSGEAVSGPVEDGYPANFRRVPMDDEGCFSAIVPKPAAQPLEDGGVQAPHLLVLVFMRGLLRNLVTRVYFAHDAELAVDAVLQAVPADRRATLIAEPDGQASYRWDVILQGQGETAFFEW